MKLTKPQAFLLIEIWDGPSLVSKANKAALALVNAGLAQWVRNDLVITEAGRRVLTQMQPSRDKYVQGQESYAIPDGDKQ